MTYLAILDHCVAKARSGLALLRAHRRRRRQKIRGQGQDERLAAVDARLQAILAALGEGVFGVNRQGVCTFINPMARALLGGQEDDFLGKNQQAILGRPAADAPAACPIVLTCADGRTRRQEDCFQRQDGSRFPVRLTVTPQLRNGEPVGAVVVFMDISESRRVAQELASARDDLERRVHERTAELAEARQFAEAASAAKSSFLANMSHEIRTPLNAILGLARLIRRDGLPVAQQERLKRVDQATQHLLDIVHDILDFSKIEAGKMALDDGPVDVAAVVDGATSMLAERAAEKGLMLTVDIGAFPPGLRGDQTRLVQGLLNFLSNAIKFTPSGGVIVRAHAVGRDAATLTLRIEVEDSGIGIATDTLAQLFAAFQQGDNSTTRQFGGTGLGLAMTRRLAEMMAGSAGADSRPGVGSTFWFTVVLRVDAAAGCGDRATNPA